DAFNEDDPDGPQKATRRAYYTLDATLSTNGGLKYRLADGVTEGYDFAGWYLVHEDGSLTHYSFDANLVTGNTFLRALWRQRGAFKVYYSNAKAVDKNGKTIDGLTVQTEGWKDNFNYAENSTVVTSTSTMQSSNPNEYTFVGWYLNTYINTGDTFVAQTVFTEKDPTVSGATAYDTFILYPVFEKVDEQEDTSDKTKLILDANGGTKVAGYNAPEGSSFNSDNTKLVWSDMAINWHVKLPEESKPVYEKDKAEFMGWAYSSDAVAPVFLPGQIIAMDNVNGSG
ncbi:MAG: InlB B-repeat-containing protein, partial [Ruminococcus sp.]|nr:InlB B-repeat-containing protein [Ruminococcus sp.]